ncbi:hypothetical protein P43SY_005526 [Pythium insidiosum]|uniref:tRNA/rRNA methyltransferase SpoU type domain-containing protein n=1 Tax=Pythium insidiosum TaxID=114742 RepID=A0AAD5QD39_PYTIN|nr:hypothetical protein P43SY_005526 [Pythium insidiosum]
MLRPRDGLVAVATLAAVLLWQNGARVYATWQGRRTRALNPLIPAQIADDDDAIDEELSRDTVPSGDTVAVPRRIRKAETVLQRRTTRIVLVIESSCDLFNQQAVLRTAECMGIQHVYIVEPAFYKDPGHRRIARQAADWLTIHRFKTTEECIRALLSDGYEIWATDLSQEAISLEDADSLEVPERLAIVMGRETDGVSQAMLAAAARRVYLPIHGFADSLNLNVATGMVLQQLFALCPEARGAMTPAERDELRAVWFRRMAKRGDDTEALIRCPPRPYGDLRRPDDHRGAWMGHKLRRRLEAKEKELKARDFGGQGSA